MSRPSSMSAPSSSRNPSLLEELEKLEQSITLTLQEIDSNFSRAHRIVTTSILPIVQDYAKHSEAVLDGSKFWKSFFEASANVTLSGYEETPPEDSYAPEDTTTTNASSTLDTTPAVEEEGDTITGASTTPPRPRSAHSGIEESELDSNILSSPSLAAAHSTPRHPSTAKKIAPPNFADYGSPYESFKREMQGDDHPGDSTFDADSTSQLPTTPAKTHIMPDTSMTPDSSPFNPISITGDGYQPQSKDPLLHTILDKTYRIGATPHRSARKPGLKAPTLTFGARTTPKGNPSHDTTRHAALDSSPLDSSPIAAPQLRAELFNSPFKGGSGPRTPGTVGTQTPGTKTRSFVPGSAAKLFKSRMEATSTKLDIWDSDDEDDLDDLGFSPPKTMQFHVPQSRLLQTPAREASKRIVEDLLLTAGGGETTDDLENSQEPSPSIVRGRAELDDSF